MRPNLLGRLSVPIVAGLALLLAASSGVEAAKAKPTRKQRKSAEMYEAAKRGDLAAVELMLDQGVDPNWSYKSGGVPLFGAGHATDARIARVMLEHGADVNYVKSEGGWTPLLLVCRHGRDLETLRVLLEAGADRRTRSQDGWNPLLLAVRYEAGHEFVQLLLADGADEIFETLPETGSTALHFAARYSGEPELIRILLERGGDRLAASATNVGWTALHNLVRYSPSAETAALLLEHGSALEARTKAGITPLMLAAVSGDAEVVRLLLEHGASPEAEGNEGETAIAWAAKYEHPEIATILQAELRRARVARTLERDAALPLTVRRDKYMVALTSRLKNEQFGDALLYFDLLGEIDVELSPSLDFYHGEALLRTDQPQAAIERLYAYLANAGERGEHYARALELVNEAEGFAD